MSFKVSVGDFMVSDVNGTGPGRTWFPRVVDQVFLGSTKDGPIKLSPDPVTMIEGDLTWVNDAAYAQHILMLVHRAPRDIVAQNPATVIIHDAWSWQIAESPSADYPTVTQDTFGGKMQIDRSSVADDKLKYGRYFLQGDDTQTYVDVGEVPSRQAVHFRYVASCQTPGTWTVPKDEGWQRWEAHARWTRLVALGSPVRDIVVPLESVAP